MGLPMLICTCGEKKTSRQVCAQFDGIFWTRRPELATLGWEKTSGWRDAKRYLKFSTACARGIRINFQFSTSFYWTLRILLNTRQGPTVTGME